MNRGLKEEKGKRQGVRAGWLKMYKTLHRHENQPIAPHAQTGRQKHKNPRWRVPLMVTPHRNASITVCMAWRERGDRSHIGDSQQNAIPGSQLEGCVSVIPTALIILPHITLHYRNSHLSVYRAHRKWRERRTHKHTGVCVYITSQGDAMLRVKLFIDPSPVFPDALFGSVMSQFVCECACPLERTLQGGRDATLSDHWPFTLWILL